MYSTMLVANGIELLQYGALDYRLEEEFLSSLLDIIKHIGRTELHGVPPETRRSAPPAQSAVGSEMPCASELTVIAVSASGSFYGQLILPSRPFS
ncbi:hypothetical protein RMATCC62417_00120 [Rhizopus microsporus]|nr:hypothetical protein RMATCC62417_00120 [Rhizopus microsporus]